MTIEEVGAYLQVPIKTLYDWRHKGCGPRGMRVGRYVRYRRQDGAIWLDSCGIRSRISSLARAGRPDWTCVAGSLPNARLGREG